MKEKIIEALTKADRLLATIPVTHDQVFLMADARRLLSIAFEAAGRLSVPESGTGEEEHDE